MDGTPNVYIMAGPNGAGKTTFAREFLPHYVGCIHFVNADLIAQGLSPFAPENAAFHAGRLMLDQVRSLGRSRQDFAFETTLSGRSYAGILRELKEKGYAIHLFFLWIPDVQLSIERVAQRVREGGHHIPEGDVRRRFHKGIRNLFDHYRPLLNSWVLFDNSTATPQVIARETEGTLEIVDHSLFARIIEEAE